MRLLPAQVRGASSPETVALEIVIAGSVRVRFGPGTDVDNGGLLSFLAKQALGSLSDSTFAILSERGSEQKGKKKGRAAKLVR